MSRPRSPRCSQGLEEGPESVRAYLVITFEAVTSVPELRPVVHQQNVAFRERIESALRDGVELGTVRRELDAVSVGIAVTAMVRGIVWEWFTDSSLDLSVCRRAMLRQVAALCAAADARCGGGIWGEGADIGELLDEPN